MVLKYDESQEIQWDVLDVSMFSTLREIAM